METEMKMNRELFDFISQSPTAWHTAESAAKRLESAGYTELFEAEEWTLRPGKGYFVRRNGSSLIAFRLPEGAARSFMIMAGHGDSPCFKLKEGPEVKAAGAYRQLNVERYGGMLLSTWMDRPLSLAGRVVVRKNGRLVSRLINIDRDLLLIPNLAIHMDRGANDGKKFDPNTDMLPLAGMLEGREIRALAAEAAGAAEEELAAQDLFVYSRAPGTVWGGDGEFISAPRLDDLQCVFACLQGFLNARETESIPVFCVFDNEEVGSGTKQGADSGFLADTLHRAWEGAGMPERDCRRALAESFMVSADNAHSVHPNHPEMADRNDRPVMNGGVVIKHNANQKYTTDAVSAAVFREICRRAGVPVQSYTNRADIAGGSTLGNISSSHVSIDTVDVGLAQLAMHSAYETAGARDTAYLARAAEAFYSSSLRRSAEGIEILSARETEEK